MSFLDYIHNIIEECDDIETFLWEHDYLHSIDIIFIKLNHFFF